MVRNLRSETPLYLEDTWCVSIFLLWGHEKNFNVQCYRDVTQLTFSCFWYVWLLCCSRQASSFPLALSAVKHILISKHSPSSHWYNGIASMQALNNKFTVQFSENTGVIGNDRRRSDYCTDDVKPPLPVFTFLGKAKGYAGSAVVDGLGQGVWLCLQYVHVCVCVHSLLWLWKVLAESTERNETDTQEGWKPGLVNSLHGAAPCPGLKGGWGEKDGERKRPMRR